jgi:hypothetical protein
VLSATALNAKKPIAQVTNPVILSLELKRDKIDKSRTANGKMNVYFYFTI